MLEKVKQFVKEAFEKSPSGGSLDHFERTLYWLLQLRPDADEAMQIAAYSHDIARAFRQTNTEETYKDRGLDDPQLLDAHQKDGAAIMMKFLDDNGYERGGVERVANMISKHEVGGDEESNLILNADSISYLEVNAPRHAQKLAPVLGRDKVKKKIDWMYERIKSEKAKKLAVPFYKTSIKLLGD